MTTDKKSTSKNIRLEDFIDENRNEALAIDISNSHPKVWEILQEQKDKLENAEFDSEREEVQQFAKNCIKSVKTRLQFYLRNNYNNTTYKNMTPPYLMEVRLLLEYRGLINSGNKIQSLSELFTHTKAAQITEDIKNQYKNIKGKRLKLLLMVLQDFKLLPNERIAKRFHQICENEFNWDIGSYQSMNDYRYNEHIDKRDYDDMKDFISGILNNKQTTY